MYPPIPRLQFFTAALRVGLILMLFAVLTLSAKADTATQAFEEANRLFERGKYVEAAQSYERLIASGQSNETLYFNLGTAWIQAGRIGLGIHALSHAHRLAPNDHEIANNLRIARLKAGRNTQDSFVDVLSKVSINTWGTLAGAGITLSFLLMAVAQMNPSMLKIFRTYFISTISVTSLICFCGISVAWQQLFARRLVIITPEAVVRRGPVAESAAVFTPADGIELKLVAEKDNWFRVQDVDGQEGWVQKDQAKESFKTKFSVN